MSQPAEELRHLEDVPLILEARVSCIPLSVADILALEPGAIIRTARAVGESADISVSNQTVATAELIVIDNRLAVRLSDFAEKR